MSTLMDETTAVTTAGAVRGKVRDGVNVFRGIPFAAPPVGKLRFRPPAPPIPWDGVLDAAHASALAPQLPSALEKMLGAPPPRWDEAQCLTLNVTTPGIDGAKRPVMFWIHGGAFVNGAGSSPIYDGTKFSQHGDVVVVTVNYRLGAFGFLHLDEVFGAELAGSGNAGILDQIAGLEWVRDNIEAFGGDPDQVTIFGESAGGMSVGTLLGMFRAEGLYHRAIVQSGGASFASTSARATRTAREVLELAGVTTVEELESVPAEALLTAQGELLKRGVGADLPFQPVVDGNVVPELPLQTIASGATGNVTTMIGTTADEMTLFLSLQLGIGSIDDAALHRQMQKLFGEGADAVIDVYRRNRADGSAGDLLTAISTDRVFRIPAIRLAEAQARQDRPTYMYLFTWATPVMDGKLKSCHALELPFVWDGVDAPGLGMLTGDGPERQGIADAMHAAWIAFARTGDPGWPAYDLDHRATKRFDTSTEILDDPQGDERALWDAVGQPTL
jgi:para-nitrobenzyl esterase